MLTHREFVHEYLPELYNQNDYEENGSVKSGCTDSGCDVGLDEDEEVGIDEEPAEPSPRIPSSHKCVFVYDSIMEKLRGIAHICKARYTKTGLTKKFVKTAGPLIEKAFDFEFMMLMPDDSDKIYVGAYPVEESLIPYYIIEWEIP
jgi:hypothetical protein